MDRLRRESPLDKKEQSAIVELLGSCARDITLQLAALEGRSVRDSVAEARVRGRLSGIDAVARMLITDKTTFLRYENAKSA